MEAALAELQRPRVLFKARALLDARHDTRKAVQGARDKGLPPAEQQQNAVAAAPAFLKGRVEQGVGLPVVVLVEKTWGVLGDGAQEFTPSFRSLAAAQEKLVACVKYALGVEYGGGVHFEGEEKPVGMLREVFVELVEMVVPKWDRARRGLPLGEEDEEEDDWTEDEEEEQGMGLDNAKNKKHTNQLDRFRLLLQLLCSLFFRARLFFCSCCLWFAPPSSCVWCCMYPLSLLPLPPKKPCGAASLMT